MMNNEYYWRTGTIGNKQERWWSFSIYQFYFDSGFFDIRMHWFLLCFCLGRADWGLDLWRPRRKTGIGLGREKDMGKDAHHLHQSLWPPYGDKETPSWRPTTTLNQIPTVSNDIFKTICIKIPFGGYIIVLFSLLDYATGDTSSICIRDASTNIPTS